MSTPSSGSSISFSQIRNTFGNRVRRKTEPFYFLDSQSIGANSSWIRGFQSATLLGFIQVTWNGVVVYSESGDQSVFFKQVVVGTDGAVYYRRRVIGTNVFSVQRVVNQSIVDPVSYSLSDYYTKPYEGTNSGLGYVPASGGDFELSGAEGLIYCPVGFPQGVPTPIPPQRVPGFTSLTNSIKFSNFQNFSSGTQALYPDLYPWSSPYSVVFFTYNPIGRLFLGFRLIGGGGGGGGRDTRAAGNGGCGTYVHGIVMLESDQPIEITAHVGGGGAGGPNGNASWYGNTAGGTVGGTSSQVFPVGGAGGKSGSSGTSGFGGGGGGGSEIWVKYGNGRRILLAQAGGGGGGGGSGNADWPSGYDSEARHGNNVYYGSNTAVAVGTGDSPGQNGGQGQNAAESAVSDGGGSGGAGGGQEIGGTGGGAYSSGTGWHEQTGRGGTQGVAILNSAYFKWLEAGYASNYRSQYNPYGSYNDNAFGAGGLAGQSNGSSGSNGQPGAVEITWSFFSIYDLLPLSNGRNSTDKFW